MGGIVYILLTRLYIVSRGKCTSVFVCSPFNAQPFVQVASINHTVYFPTVLKTEVVHLNICAVAKVYGGQYVVCSYDY